MKNDTLDKVNKGCNTGIIIWIGVVLLFIIPPVGIGMIIWGICRI